MAFVREAENLYQRNRRALVELLIETKFRKLSGFFNEIDSLVLTIPLVGRFPSYAFSSMLNFPSLFRKKFNSNSLTINRL